MKTLIFLLTPLFPIFVFAASFKKGEVVLNKIKIKVEIADHEEAWGQGLMFRKSMAENEGMLFVFPEAKMQSFWMKNTLIPLSIGYFDSNKKLINIHEMEPVSDLVLNPPTYQSAKPAQYALEMNKAWFTKNKIKVGTKLDFHIAK